MSHVSKRLYRLTLKLHKTIIFENKDDRRLFINEGLCQEDKSISIKGCGVNIDHFHADTINFPPHDIFTFIGRLLYDKGIKEFVAAAEIVKLDNPNAQFWLIGDLDDENPASVKQEDILAWVRQGIVTYHGATTDVRPFINQSSCIVLPSYREAIARSLTEAMSMKKPVIATNVAGCKEAVDHLQTGFLVKPKDVSDLANTMISFIELSETEKRQLGAKGHLKVLAEFDDRIIANAIFDISIAFL